MKLIQTLTMITWVLVMLVACGGISDGDPLNGTTWELYSIGKYSPIVGSVITIYFEDGRVTGNSGCNSYGSEYQVHGNKIEFGIFESTLMACADMAMMDQEQLFLQRLGDARSFEIMNDQLQISQSDGETLTFVRAQ